MNLAKIEPHTSDARASIAGFPVLHRRPASPRPAAPPVLFLHGAFADETCFSSWVERFTAAGYEAYAPSRRGRHGIGPRNAAGLSFDDYIADTNRVIDELGRLPVIVGHSLGGLLAQRLAEQGRASAIALIASAPPGMLTSQPVALPRFLPKMARILSGRPFAVGGKAASSLALNKVPADQRPAILAHFTPESGRVYRALIMGTVRVAVDKVTVPVFVGGGDQDRIISRRLLAKTARVYRVTPRVYPGHGHWILEEPAWEQVVDDVLAWIHDLEPPAAAGLGGLRLSFG